MDSSSHQDTVSNTQEPMKAKEADGSSKDEQQQEEEQQQQQLERKQQHKQQNQQQQKQEMTVVDLSQYTQAHDSKSADSFALEAHQRNSSDNPYRENTSTMPYLVRRVNSEELLPSPFKSTCQLLCVSYLASLCCVCFSAYAVKHAWQAKEKRNAGVFSRAVKEAKHSCFCLKLALGFGIALWLMGVLMISIHLTVGL